MSNIKVLDCTLRDGGYINNWTFGVENAGVMIQLMLESKIDYVEIGFITTEKSFDNQTLFTSFNKIKDFLPDKCYKDSLLGMVTYGKFPIENIPDVSESPIGGIRVIFKKHQQEDALEYCRNIKEKGYRLFINPTFTDQYSEEEFLLLIKKIEKINPYSIAIVDSMGAMKEKDISHLYNVIDKNLNSNIALCFHSHDNMQLSFSNSQYLIKNCKNRELIVDSTLFGMGRGAGNLSTEVIIGYLNYNFDCKYDINLINKLVDEYINPIFAETPWGYSIPYYLAATNHCHPNYAKYLIDRHVGQIALINNLLQSIPMDKKAIYDVSIIENIYNSRIPAK